MKHYLVQELANSQHKVTVLVIGTGGTGSHVLTNLGMINQALKALERPELHVCAIDPDIVEEHNVGRQNFSEADLGRNKAIVCIERLNRYYGTEWNAANDKFVSNTSRRANVIISCVDNLKTRKEIEKDFIIKSDEKNRGNFRYHPFYWMDFGNSQNSGQVIISTFNSISQPEGKTKKRSKLPTFFEEWPDVKEEPNQPSCSMAEALQKQDLFTNKILATHGVQLLYQLLKNYYIEHRGLYMNLDSGKILPIPV